MVFVLQMEIYSRHLNTATIYLNIFSSPFLSMSSQSRWLLFEVLFKTLEVIFRVKRTESKITCERVTLGPNCLRFSFLYFKLVLHIFGIKVLNYMNGWITVKISVINMLLLKSIAVKKYYYRASKPERSEKYLAYIDSNISVEDNDCIHFLVFSSSRV